MTAGELDKHNKSQLDSEACNSKGRVGHDSDMASCVLVLAGPAGIFLNSQNIYPDVIEILFPPQIVSTR